MATRKPAAPKAAPTMSDEVFTLEDKSKGKTKGKAAAPAEAPANARSMYDDEAAQGPTTEQLANISAAAKRQMALEDEIAVIEKSLKEKQKALNEIVLKELPDAMQAAGVKGYTLLDGSKIEIKGDYTASITAALKPAACSWLRSHGFGDLVSEAVTLEFGKGKEADAAKFADFLRKKGYQPSCETTVNTASVKALIREQVAEGKPMPLEVFGAFEWKKSIITRPGK